MSFKNPFFFKPDHYKRDINPIKHYVHQTAYYLSIEKNIPLDKAKKIIIKYIKEKKFKMIKDPKVIYFQRDIDTGDKEKTQISLSKYIGNVIRDKELLAPSMTTYLPKETRESILSLSIIDKVNERNIAKKAMFAAEAKGDTVEQFFQNVKQKGTKLSNNSISGMHNSNGNPLYNPSSHSTLTSNCRMTSGYGNANNEKLLAGNRHYFKSTIIFNNLLSIISNTDYDKLEQVINKYQLYLPTTQDVIDCILYSSQLYGLVSGQWLDKIRNFVDKLNPYQKAAFIYTGDLYHIRKHNDDFVRKFITELIEKRINKITDDPISLIKSLHEDHVIVAHQICNVEMEGKGKDYKALENTETLDILSSTSHHVSYTLDKYSDFIETLLVTTNIPAAVPYFPDSIRRIALISDTDSTIFTAQEWQKWYHGKTLFTPEAKAVGAMMVFLASQAIINVLAIMSRNAGIPDEYLYKIAMKNEFYFPVIVPTKVAKHYFGIISCQEGNVYSKDKYKYDIKGVHLKSSNAPAYINKASEAMMKDIMHKTMNNEPISMLEYLKNISDIEKTIYKGIQKGDPKYFRIGEIKTPDSYKKGPTESNYIHHLFWDECLSDYYGKSGDPSYRTLMIKTTLDNPSKTLEWLETMENKELSKRIKHWLNKYKKTELPTLQIPLHLIGHDGLPKEIADIIDARMMVINLTKVFYLLLDTLGFDPLNDKKTMLISDYY